LAAPAKEVNHYSLLVQKRILNLSRRKIMKKNGFTLVELLIVCAIVFIIGISAYSCFADSLSSKDEVQVIPGFDYKEALQSARNITVKEKVWSLGKHYIIFADGKEVAKVKGKDLPLWADKFVLTTLDGRKIAHEDEIKKFFQLDRVAEVFDSENKLCGFIGEKTTEDFFSWSHKFHIYDKNRREIGVSSNFGNGMFGNFSIKDSPGKVCYNIKKKFDFVDVYQMEVFDRETIPVEIAIFIVCIEDAIKDSKDDDDDDD
jgi:uncharacterized protein YxjI